ncbi:entry exclusion lipoprotein TrbK [Variovorax sp. RHLX14]|uniref:entry exclusion lipoprotein TrbK n=1 Tax=Variovorax sp. RHLX14 TaxID=1259731 RepID=UPI003F478C10
MNRQHSSLTLVLATLFAAGLAGCGKSDTPVAPTTYSTPEVNDTNCSDAAIQAMPVTDAIRREFGSKCARRGSYTPSPTKSW